MLLPHPVYYGLSSHPVVVTVHPLKSRRCKRFKNNVQKLAFLLKNVRIRFRSTKNCVKVEIGLCHTLLLRNVSANALFSYAQKGAVPQLCVVLLIKYSFYYRKVGIISPQGYKKIKKTHIIFLADT